MIYFPLRPSHSHRRGDGKYPGWIISLNHRWPFNWMIACYTYMDTTKRVCMALEQCIAQLWSPFSPLEALQGAGGSSTSARRRRGSSGLPLPRSRQRGLSHRCSLPCTAAASSFAPNSMPRNTRGNTSPGRSCPVLVKALQKCIAST